MRVLFVEDDALNRRVVRDMLAIAGVDLDEAPDAEAGLEMIQKTQYDLVLMDLRMPGMDGLTAIRHLRYRSADDVRVPIVVLTADSGEDMHQKCLAAGADRVVCKPIAMQLLFETVGQVFSGTDCINL